MILPDTRKPAEGNSAGFRNIDKRPGKIDTGDDIENLVTLQASRLRRRFAMSLALARAVAELHWRAA